MHGIAEFRLILGEAIEAVEPRACGFPGISLRCTFGSWQASFSAIESAWPRTMAASRLVILRAGSGSRALPGARPGRSEANVTSSSGALAIARRQAVTARLNGSVGASFDPVRNLLLDVVIAASPPSSPRRRGPITTGGRYLSRLWLHHSIETPRRMGPRLRGDDAYESATFTEDSGSSALKQR
jgi:hypothetical protein